MDKNLSKYVITKEHLNLISDCYSNHPKRPLLFKAGKKDKDENPKLVDLKNWTTFNKTINIIAGDSHVEYLGRLFKEVVEGLGSLRSVNRTYCFWTGAPTLIGSIQSSSYYHNVLRSVAIILERLKEKIVFNRLNIVISLGEIDVRTKLFLESTANRIKVQEVIDEYCNEKLVEKIKILKDGLNNLFRHLEINIFFKSPPPPSHRFPVRDPKNAKELNKIFESEPYPTFLSLDERRKNHAQLIKSIKLACTIGDISFLSDLYEHDNSLDQSMSLDGVHIAKGDWAILNSKQIFNDI